MGENLLARKFVIGLILVLSQFLGFPISAQEPTKISDCQGSLPEDSGREFGGEFFFTANGRLFTASSLIDSFKVRELPTSPFSEPIKYRNNAFYTCDQDKKAIYKWEFGIKRWILWARPTVGFSEFDILFDERVLLLATFDSEKQKLGSLVACFDRNNGMLREWKAFPDRMSMPVSLDEILYWGEWKTFPYQEYILIYGPYSGRVLFVNGLEGTVEELKCDWKLERDPAHPEITPRPTCIQFVPTGENSFMALYPMLGAHNKKGMGKLDVNLITGEAKFEILDQRPLPLWINEKGSIVSAKEIMDSASSSQHEPSPLVKKRTVHDGKVNSHSEFPRLTQPDPHRSQHQPGQ